MSTHQRTAGADDHPPADDYLRRALDETLATLSESDLDRLRAARSAALSRRPRVQPRRPPWWQPLWPTSALATAAVLLVMLHAKVAHLDAGHKPPLDADLIGSAAPLEMLEDLEFYEWLDGDDTTG